MTNEKKTTGLQMKYFVLKPEGNSRYAYASRLAMGEYASAIHSENKELAESLIKWASECRIKAKNEDRE